jgi:hypothetical protein
LVIEGDAGNLFRDGEDDVKVFGVFRPEWIQPGMSAENIDKLNSS